MRLPVSRYGRKSRRIRAMGFAALFLTIGLVHTDIAPERTLADAKAVAAVILKTAGIEAIWQVCESAENCAGASLRLEVLSAGARGLHGDTAGYAVIDSAGGGDYSAVSYA